MTWLRRDDPVVKARLGHRTGKGEFIRNPQPGVAWRSTTEYLLIPLALARPEEGVGPLRITCPACDKELAFQVSSVREVQRKRLIQFAIAVALAVYVAVPYATGITKDVQNWEHKGTLATIAQTIVAASFFVAVILSVVLFYRAFSSQFRRAVIAPNMAYWLGRNHPDSIRMSFYKKRTGPADLQDHSIFPPTGKLANATSL